MTGATVGYQPTARLGVVARGQLAQLSPEVRERLARTLAAAGASAIGLAIRELFDTHPLVSLGISLFLDFLIEPLLVDLVHSVLA